MKEQVTHLRGRGTQSTAVSIEAEQALLGAVLTDVDVWPTVSDLWREDLFSDPAHQAIARAVSRLQREKRPVDPVLVQVELDGAGELGTVVPHILPLELGRALGSGANARHYLLVLKDLREQRGAAPDGLDALSLRNHLDVEGLESETPRLPTGWKRLDAKLGGGFSIPSLNILGAAPKSGKSTWAKIVVERHVERGGFALVFDLENGQKRSLRQMIARRARVGLDDVLAALRDKRAGVFRSKDDSERWYAAKAEMWDKLGPRLFMQFAVQKPEDVAARVAAVRKRAGDAPLLVLIDSLQKLPLRLDERRASIDWWLRSLEQLRERHNAVILLISELKRGDDGYKAREDAFKESGSIEYTGDLALTLTRPSVDETDEPPPDSASTLRVVLFRDAPEDPRGLVASYKPQFPWYGLEEIGPQTGTSAGAAPKRKQFQLMGEGSDK